MEDNLVLTTALQMVENMSYENKLQFTRKLFGKACLVTNKQYHSTKIYFDDKKEDIVKLIIEDNHFNVFDVHKCFDCDDRCSQNRHCFICLSKFYHNSPIIHLKTHNMSQVNEIILDKFIDKNFVFNFVNEDELDLKQ